jgi:hypothetical protein
MQRALAGRVPAGMRDPAVAMTCGPIIDPAAWMTVTLGQDSHFCGAAMGTFGHLHAARALIRGNPFG